MTCIMYHVSCIMYHERTMIHFAFVIIMCFFNKIRLGFNWQSCAITCYDRLQEETYISSGEIKFEFYTFFVLLSSRLDVFKLIVPGLCAMRWAIFGIFNHWWKWFRGFHHKQHWSHKSGLWDKLNDNAVKTDIWQSNL